MKESGEKNQNSCYFATSSCSVMPLMRLQNPFCLVIRQQLSGIAYPFSEVPAYICWKVMGIAYFRNGMKKEKIILRIVSREHIFLGGENPHELDPAPVR